ncbi:MAG: 1-(5-phosphoribosyl)-5-[(5-phosphoribosylamino)methylideneamino] imidazole-4-carboxamide isomerase [Rhodobacteraceae bacterium]|nr:1-(5-phosphoribosyl)-5-[(5-phosphoribosylamino)methylideneamino] imidazole-4-carboxamide isomerase [Paracoccaceae bacterium]
MMILPSMEITKGRCVSLKRGRTDEPVVWHVDAVEKAREFAASGAAWMHLTDIDAVLGDSGNRDLMLRILRQAGIPVQLAGGFRSLDLINEWIELGAGRIVIGTLAVLRPDIVKMAAKLHPDQIVVAVDVWQGNVMIEGWNKPSAISPQALISEFSEDPLAAVMVTDIDANIEFRQSGLDLLTELAGYSRTPFIASGMVTSLDDIERLKSIPNVIGTLVGTALFNKTIELPEALAAAQPENPFATGTGSSRG